MTRLQTIASVIPTDECPNHAVIVHESGYQESWFVVGPRCLELYHQFMDELPDKPVDPYVSNVLKGIE